MSEIRPPLPVPPLACDSHAHVVGPFERYPLQEPRSYTPPEGTAEDYLAMLKEIGVERGVIVQPSFFGLDNSCTLDFVAARLDRFRAVVVVDETVTDAELARMHAQGARGIRVNLVYKGGVDLAAAARLGARIAPLGWHVQVLMHITALPEMVEDFAALPVPVVFDHMGHFPASHGTDWPGFNALRALAARHEVWVKLSGAYRLDPTPEFGAVAAPVARALIAEMPDRVVWGTDWPHVGTANTPASPQAQMDDLFSWCDHDAGLVQRILVDNPSRLYGFG